MAMTDLRQQYLINKTPASLSATLPGIGGDSRST